MTPSVTPVHQPPDLSWDNQILLETLEWRLRFKGRDTRQLWDVILHLTRRVKDKGSKEARMVKTDEKWR